MQQPNPTSDTDQYELTFTPGDGIGKLIEGRILRPEAYQFTAAVDLLTQDFVVAMTLAPSECDPIYSEPVVVFVKFKLVDAFIKGVLSARGLVAAEARNGGTV